jgi:hypothetical protein
MEQWVEEIQQNLPPILPLISRNHQTNHLLRKASNPLFPKGQSNDGVDNATTLGGGEK